MHKRRRAAIDAGRRADKIMCGAFRTSPNISKYDKRKSIQWWVQSIQSIQSIQSSPSVLLFLSCFLFSILIIYCVKKRPTFHSTIPQDTGAFRRRNFQKHPIITRIYQQRNGGVLTRNALFPRSRILVIYWLAGIETGERIEWVRGLSIFGGCHNIVVYMMITIWLLIVVDSSRW
jgi:hypothetical protein